MLGFAELWLSFNTVFALSSDCTYVPTRLFVWREQWVFCVGLWIWCSFVFVFFASIERIVALSQSMCVSIKCYRLCHT